MMPLVDVASTEEEVEAMATDMEARAVGSGVWFL